MKTFLWLAIVGSAFALLSVAGARQPLESRPAAAQEECKCKDLKVLEIELRNAIQVQQNFRNKIADLRPMNRPTSQNALQIFAQGDALRGHTPVPDYKGPDHVDYFPWGRDLHADADQSKYTNAQLCRRSDSAEKTLGEAKDKSACAGIAAATQAHEDFHVNFCQRIGYANYEAMHGADRAQEEVEAYGVEIAMLRAEIARVRDLKDCKHYRASGHDGPVVYSGVICNLDKPFTVTGTHPMLVYPLKFVPSSTTGGTFSYAVSSGMMSMEGGGTYRVEGLDTDKPHIVCQVSSTARIPTASSSGSGIGNIQLIPLDTDECNGQ
jgi:hypothetical protein